MYTIDIFCSYLVTWIWFEKPIFHLLYSSTFLTLPLSWFFILNNNQLGHIDWPQRVSFLPFTTSPSLPALYRRKMLFRSEGRSSNGTLCRRSQQPATFSNGTERRTNHQPPPSSKPQNWQNCLIAERKESTTPKHHET